MGAGRGLEWVLGASVGWLSQYEWWAGSGWWFCCIVNFSLVVALLVDYLWPGELGNFDLPNWVFLSHDTRTLGGWAQYAMVFVDCIQVELVALNRNKAWQKLRTYITILSRKNTLLECCYFTYEFAFPLFAHHQLLRNLLLVIPIALLQPLKLLPRILSLFLFKIQTVCQVCVLLL